MALNGLGFWEIIEIKTPRALIIKDSERRHALRATTESYLSQCVEYANLFMDRAYRDRFNSQYNADCHKTPNVTLIMGRNEGLDRKQLQQILSHRSNPHIEIKTFDDIREIISQYIQVSCDLPQSRTHGFCIAFSAILQHGEGDLYIFDLSKRGGPSRIKGFTRQGGLNIEIVDEKGSEFHIDIAEHVCREYFNRYLNPCSHSPGMNLTP